MKHLMLMILIAIAWIIYAQCSIININGNLTIEVGQNQTVGNPLPPFYNPGDKVSSSINLDFFKKRIEELIECIEKKGNSNLFGLVFNFKMNKDYFATNRAIQKKVTSCENKRKMNKICTAEELIVYECVKDYKI